MVPATGTVVGRAAEEFAYTIGDRHDADVDVVHVLSRTDRHGPEHEPSTVAHQTVVAVVFPRDRVRQMGRQREPSLPSLDTDVALEAE